MDMTHNHSQKGFSLFEILVVVGISAMALVGVYQVGAHIQLRNQTDQTIRTLTKVVSEAVAYKKIQSNYAALNCNTLDEGCYLVQRKIVNADQKTAFGGGIEVSSPGAASKLKVSFQNIPQQACTDLLLSMNTNPFLSKVELFNPDQQSINNNEQQLGLDGNPLPVCPPQDESAATEEVGVVKPPAGTEVCQAGGGYSVMSIQSFPASGADLSSVCGNLSSMTIAWTFN
jgi:prepilin-type N-terminal cleavage/methylation domain-containing protein